MNDLEKLRLIKEMKTSIIISRDDLCCLIYKFIREKIPCENEIEMKYCENTASIRSIISFDRGVCQAIQKEQHFQFVKEAPIHPNGKPMNIQEWVINKCKEIKEIKE